MPTASAKAQTGSKATATPEKKPRKPRTTVGPPVFDTESVVTVSKTDIPHEARRRGTRDNAFDKLLEASYERNDEAADDFVQITCKPEHQEANLRAIRTSAAFLNIGARVLKPITDDNGNVTISFRAQTKRARKSKDDSNEG